MTESEKKQKGVKGWLLAAGSAFVVGVVTIAGYLAPPLLRDYFVIDPDRYAGEAVYFESLDEADYDHPMVGAWRSRDRDNPFVLVILPQTQDNPDVDKFEGHSVRRVWRGWKEGDALQLYYLPRADEMNVQIPRAVRDQIDGLLEWRLDLSFAGDDVYDRRLKAVWQRGEVAWDENGRNGEIIGEGEPLEFELVYDPLLLVRQDGPITISVESASVLAEDDVPVPVSAVLQDQRVFFNVIMPFREFEQVGESLTVDIRGLESGASQTLTLRVATTSVFGSPVRYSHQFAVSLGECGGDRARYKPTVLSPRWFFDLEGDGDCLDFVGARHGELVEVSYRDAAFRFYWYPTWVQAALDAQMEEAIRMKIILEGFQVADRSRTARDHTRRKLQMIENYMTLMEAEFLTDLHRIAIGEVYLGGSMSPAALRIPRDPSISLPVGGLLHYTDDDFRRLASSTGRLTTSSESTMWAETLAFFGGEQVGTRAAEGIRAMTNVRWTPIYTGEPENLRPEENQVLNVRSDEKTLVYSAVRAASSQLLDEAAKAFYEGATFALYDTLANTAPFVANLHTLATGTDHFGRKVSNLEYWLSAVGLGSEIILTNSVLVDMASHASSRVGRRMKESALIAEETRGAVRALPIRVQARTTAPAVTTVSRVVAGDIAATPGMARPSSLPASVPTQAVEELLAVRFDAVPDQRIRLDRPSGQLPEAHRVQLVPEASQPRPAPDLSDFPTPSQAAQRLYGPNARAQVVGGDAAQAFFLPPAEHMDRVVAANYGLWKQKGLLIDDMHGAHNMRLVLDDAVRRGQIPADRAVRIGVMEPFPVDLVDQYLTHYNAEVTALNPARNRAVTAADVHAATQTGWTVQAHMDLGTQGGKRVVVVERVLMEADGVTPAAVQFFDPAEMTLVEIEARTFNRLLDRELPHGNLRAMRVGDPRAPPIPMAPAPRPLQVATSSQVFDQPVAGATFRFIDEAGREQFVRLDQRLGQGANSEAYALRDHPGFVMRVSRQPATTPAAMAELLDNRQIDGFGRAALNDERVNRNFIRGVVLRDSTMTPGGRLVEILEQAPADWYTMKPRFGGEMTQGQMLAFEAGHRALNEAGYAWVDNHAGNFTFEPLPGGGDRWRMVVIDPGGILPATGANQAARAANARRIQAHINSPANAYTQGLNEAQQMSMVDPRAGGELANRVAAQLIESERVMQLVDTRAWGLSPQSGFPFTIRTVLEHPALRAFHNLNPGQFTDLYNAHYGN